jgi:hypothetical protein
MACVGVYLSIRGATGAEQKVLPYNAEFAADVLRQPILCDAPEMEYNALFEADVKNQRITCDVPPYESILDHGGVLFRRGEIGLRSAIFTFRHAAARWLWDHHVGVILFIVFMLTLTMLYQAYKRLCLLYAYFWSVPSVKTDLTGYDYVRRYVPELQKIMLYYTDKNGVVHMSRDPEISYGDEQPGEQCPKTGSAFTTLEKAPYGCVRISKTLDSPSAVASRVSINGRDILLTAFHCRQGESFWLHGVTPDGSERSVEIQPVEMLCSSNFDFYMATIPDYYFKLLCVGTLSIAQPSHDDMSCQVYTYDNYEQVWKVSSGKARSGFHNIDHWCSTIAGASGSPLMRGNKVIGVHFYGIKNPDKPNHACSMDFITSLLDQFESQETPGGKGKKNKFLSKDEYDDLFSLKQSKREHRTATGNRKKQKKNNKSSQPSYDEMTVGWTDSSLQARYKGQSFNVATDGMGQWTLRETDDSQLVDRTELDDGDWADQVEYVRRGAYEMPSAKEACSGKEMPGNNPVFGVQKHFCTQCGTCIAGLPIPLSANLCAECELTPWNPGPVVLAPMPDPPPSPPSPGHQECPELKTPLSLEKPKAQKKELASGPQEGQDFQTRDKANPTKTLSQKKVTDSSSSAGPSSTEPSSTPMKQAELTTVSSPDQAKNQTTSRKSRRSTRRAKNTESPSKDPQQKKPPTNTRKAASVPPKSKRQKNSSQKPSEDTQQPPTPGMGLGEVFGKLLTTLESLQQSIPTAPPASHMPKVELPTHV